MRSVLTHSLTFETIPKLNHVVWLRQANAGNDMKNILHIWFSHFTLTEIHRWQNFSLLYFDKKKKKILHEIRVDPFT